MTGPELYVAEADGPSRRWRTRRVEWAEIVGWAQNPADRKDCGGYILGRLSGTVATLAGLVDRCGITLDFDKDVPGLADRVAALGVTALLHTSYSSAPDERRWRLIVPLSEPVEPSRYQEVAAALACALDAVREADPCSYTPSQFMWKPSERQPGWGEHHTFTGRWATPDEWADALDDDKLRQAQRPLHRQTKSRKANPESIPGVIGAFNRAYPDLAELIEAFELPYVRADEHNWRFAESHHLAGMAQVPDLPGVYVSHHATDPAYGSACNAFDLVRLHKFGELDARTATTTPVNRRPSFRAMLDFAAELPEVKRQPANALAAARSAAADFAAPAAPDPTSDPTSEPAIEIAPVAAPAVEGMLGSWADTLVRNTKSNETTDCARNLELIAANDDALSCVYFDRLRASICVRPCFPWEDARAIRQPTVDERDLAKLGLRLENEYGLRLTTERMWVLLVAASALREEDPLAARVAAIRDRGWDGIGRLDTCLSGADDTPYTRMAVRKGIMGMVKRAIDPGCKVDHGLILTGREGLGKTTWCTSLGLSEQWVTELGAIGDKDTLATMHSSTIVLADELDQAHKAEFAKLKSFLTRTHDTYRQPYAKQPVQHARRCVVWGTTNERRFLKDQEGNRRFLPIQVNRRIDRLSVDEVEQVWAEALHALEVEGEQHYLSPEEERLARAERSSFVEHAPNAGLINHYASMRVPGNWTELSAHERRSWVAVESGATSPDELASMPLITELSAVAVAHEAFGIPLSAPTARYVEVSRALERLPGWVALDRPADTGAYGEQIVYVRIDDLI